MQNNIKQKILQKLISQSMLLPEQPNRGTPIQQLESFIAVRLLPPPSDSVKQPEGPPTPVQITPREPTLTVSDFVKIEKNLISLGFFTPSSKRIKSLKLKSIKLTQISPNGDRLEATATIVPAAIYGLPITADQDKWFALQRIINDIKQEVGEVHNPITFTSSDIIKLLGQGDAGKNYREVSEWLDLMANTGIISEGAVYLAGRRTWARDRFRVFDRAVSMGKQLDDGSIADRNYVWLSDWQLENINYNYLLPIDYDAYTRLHNHIAKALVPLLQVWLYASRNKGSFEKRYDELCQILNVRQYRHHSKIKEKLAPSLNELQEAGYLSRWSVEKTTDRKAHKIVFYHGEKFHRDRQQRRERKQTLDSATQRRIPTHSEQGNQDILVTELVRRGVTENRARKLLRTLAADQHLIDQLEWADHLIAQAPPGKFYNPAGLFITLINENVTPPASFESSRKRKLRLQADLEKHEQARLQLAYEQYKSQEIDDYIDSHYDEYRSFAEAKKQEMQGKHKNMALWDEDTLTRLAESSARAQLAKRISFDTFGAFREQQRRNESHPPQPEQRSGPTDQFLTV